MSQGDGAAFEGFVEMSTTGQFPLPEGENSCFLEGARRARLPSRRPSTLPAAEVRCKTGLRIAYFLARLEHSFSVSGSVPGHEDGLL